MMNKMASRITRLEEESIESKKKTESRIIKLEVENMELKEKVNRIVEMDASTSSTSNSRKGKKRKSFCPQVVKELQEWKDDTKKRNLTLEDWEFWAKKIKTYDEGSKCQEVETVVARMKRKLFILKKSRQTDGVEREQE